jgi:hypothetical protein
MPNDAFDRARAVRFGVGDAERAPRAKARRLASEADRPGVQDSRRHG